MNTQLREAVLSGQVSAAQVVQHQLAGELDMANSDESCQGVEMEPDSCLTTVRTALLYGLASIGLVALCIAAGFLWAIYR